jgi:uncharacterized protein (TIGR02145 family)
MNNLVIIAFVFLGLLNSIVAQTQLQYQLNQQGNGSCSGSTVTLSVSTSVNITTAAVSEISSNAATTGGNITNDGGNPVTQCGVCWSTSPNPTTNDNITNNGNGLGSFTSNLSGLSSSTTYYLRAYAINSAGIFYGNEVTFTTPNEANTSTHSCGAENVHNPNLSYGSMTDQDGNIYKTIVIGNQEWMAENLKTSIYRNGDPIPNVSDAVQWTGLSTGAWCFYNNESQNDCPYGKLYNWYTVADPRYVCPNGWHIPTDAEWTTLTSFLGGEGDAGGEMKSTGGQYWFSPNTDATNESGFSALPGGVRDSTNGNFYGIGNRGCWWSSSEFVLSYASYRFLYYNFGFALSDFYNKRIGFSVRCLRD